MAEIRELPVTSWQLPEAGRVGMFGLIAAESCIFAIAFVAYCFYLGKPLEGPTPKQILRPPYFYTICLLLSSYTIHRALSRLRQRSVKHFGAWWLCTICLGGIFLYGTANEWHHLIYDKEFTISTNVFGTTYYSLVGLHGIHVVVGLILMSVVLAFTWLGFMDVKYAKRTEVLSLYWHFVDTVWVFVFTVVYIIGR